MDSKLGPSFKLTDLALKIFTDPEYHAIVVPDEERFIKRNESVPIVGWDEDNTLQMCRSKKRKVSYRAIFAPTFL